MLRFTQYLSEIFNATKKHSIHGDHPDLRRDNEDMVEYHYTPTDTEGKPIHAKTIKTTFLSAGPKDRWEVMFKVGGFHANTPAHEFPSDVTKRVFDHIAHFVDTTRELIGKSPTLIYDTQHPKKHRIYQAAAKRLGVKAHNMSALDPDLDRGGKKKSTHDNEPWIADPDPISEAFTPHRDRREWHPDLTTDPVHIGNYANYSHTKMGASGKPLYRINTNIQTVDTHGDPLKGWTDVEFRINGAYDKADLSPESKVAPHHVMQALHRVFDHVNHYHSMSGFGKGILFATKNRKKHDLYMRIADRFGVPALNVQADRMK